MPHIALDPSVQFMWAVANGEACFAGAERIEPVHYLLAILNIADDLIGDDLDDLRLPPEALDALTEFAALVRPRLQADDTQIANARRSIRQQLRQGKQVGAVRMLHRSDASREMFRRAGRRAMHDGADAVTISTILEEIIASVPMEVAAHFPDCPPLDAKVSPQTSSYSQGSRWQIINGNEQGRPSIPTHDLGDLGRDLTLLAKAGRLPPVVGRRAEVKATIRLLSRTSKRGVMLVGSPGVGKTAIVEGLAQIAVSDHGPAALRGLRIIQINVSALIAGTRYRGDMEERVQRLLEVLTADPRLVLFVDEVHLAVHGGAAGGSLDVANMLKPHLARDDLRCIGATTTEEFERYIRPDGAFARRFQIVRVSEPSFDEALSIADAWRDRIERLQDVRFAPNTVKAAVSFATDHLTDRCLPDSAIDLLENAATFANVSTLTSRSSQPSKTTPTVTEETLEAVLLELHGIDINPQIIDASRLRRCLERALVGQDPAIAEIASGIQVASAAKRGPRRSPAVLLFAGPTGVGKTLAAEVLAGALFGDTVPRFSRFNMSELKERHELARLIGAPPGFVGHDHAPALFSFVRSHPRGTILLDEMEKAHPEIQDYFLDIFDNGTARDSHGRPADFSQFVFVLTCNLQTDARGIIGFAQPGSGRAGERGAPPRRGALEAHFKAEFLARVDRIVAFAPLTTQALHDLLGRHVDELAIEFEQAHEVRLCMTDAAKHSVARGAQADRGGAREFLRNVDRLLVIPLRRFIAEHPDRSRVDVDVVDGVVRFG